MTIKLTDVVKSFKNEVVLDGVSLSVEAGETLVLFGPSGAGKTVLLRLIAGVIDPDEGRIEVNGRDMEGVEPEDRGMGMAFQNFALFPHMTAFDNIASPLTARRQNRTTLKAGVESVAKLLKIDHVLGHMPKALSNGQKQRTALARALAAKPNVLLLDDPLRNVDAKLRFEMRLELPRLLKQQNATVIYVTQDYKEAMAFGDRIAVMDGHGIRQVGTPEHIYLRPASTKIASLFGDPAINLLEVRPERGEHGVQVRLSGRAIPLDRRHAASIGHDCLLGVRPETIRFVPEGTPGAVPVEVEAETPLNEKTVTLVWTRQRREIMVSRPSGSIGPAHGRAWIVIDPGHAMLFDKESGARIDPSSDAAALQGEVA